MLNKIKLGLLILATVTATTFNSCKKEDVAAAIISPTILTFTPEKGDVGSSVVITGTNFSATKTDNEVKFNGAKAEVTSATITSLTVTVPADATTGKITVTAGGQTGTSSKDYTVNAPTITKVSPASTRVGVIVTITGTGFSANKAEDTVKFNGVKADVSSAVVVNGIGTITTNVPVGATSGKLTVKVGNQTASTDFTVSTNITVTFDKNHNDAKDGDITSISVAPKSPIGPAIYDLKKSPNVTRTGYSLTSWNTKADGTGTSYLADIANDNQSASSDLTLYAQWTVTDPTITDVVGTLTGTSWEGFISDIVVIKGTNFNTTAANNVVKFGNVTVTEIIDAAATQLTVKIPADAVTGKVTVEVGGKTATSANDFTIKTINSVIAGKIYQTDGQADCAITGNPYKDFYYFDGTNVYMQNAQNLNSGSSSSSNFYCATQRGNYPSATTLDQFYYMLKGAGTSPQGYNLGTNYGSTSYVPPTSYTYTVDEAKKTVTFNGMTLVVNTQSGSLYLASPSTTYKKRSF